MYELEPRKKHVEELVNTDESKATSSEDEDNEDIDLQHTQAPTP